MRSPGYGRELSWKKAGSGAAGPLAVCIVLLFVATAFIASTGCIGMLKIANETGKKMPASSEERTALLQQIIAETEEGASQDGTDNTRQPEVYVIPTTTPFIQPDALKIRQEYVYGDHEHEIHATAYNVTLLPFYFWWFIDYNKFVAEQPAAGNQFLVIFLRFENTGTKSALVPSAEVLPLVYGEEIYMHRPYFNNSALSSYQKEIYGGANENVRLPYQWIRELGQDKRDYAFLTGYHILNTGNTTSSNSTVTNGSATSTAVSCMDAISVPTESGKVLIQDITDGQCPGFFIKPGSSNAIDGYLIYEVPETIDLKHTYFYGLFNRYSWTRWRLG